MANDGEGIVDELTPRQMNFLKYYLDPKSETFSNALRSALKAGYSQEYSESITSQTPQWLAENLGDAKMIKKAEKRINNLLDSNEERISLDATKFVLSRLHKKKWSDRTELTGVEGKPLFLPSELLDKNNIQYETSSSTKSDSKG